MIIRRLLAALEGHPRPVRYGLLAVGVLVAVFLPWMIYPRVATDIIVWGLFAVALDLLLGYTGLLSFGHAAFWGTAAYIAGTVAIETGLPFVVAVLVAAIGAAVLALPIGWLAVRRSGIYFAMVTLAFAQMVYFVCNQWRSVTGGEDGLQAIPRPFFGVDLSEDFVFYYAALPVVLIGLWIAWRAVHSPFGRVLVAIRDNPARASSLGYPVARYKVMAFVLSAFLSGLAGGLYAINQGFASLQEVYWTTSGTVVVMTVLGGIGTLWGPLLGAMIVVRLRDFLATAGIDATNIVIGLIFVLVVLLFRRGIWGSAAHLRRRYGTHSGEPDPEPHLTAEPSASSAGLDPART